MPMAIAMISPVERLEAPGTGLGVRNDVVDDRVLETLEPGSETAVEVLTKLVGSGYSVTKKSADRASVSIVPTLVVGTRATSETPP